VKAESTPGFYSIAGASAKTPCTPGTYTDKYLADTCANCPAGYSCPDSAMSNFTHYLCPAGSYCPETSINPVKCDPGTYASTEGNIKAGNCLACLPGSYCETAGLAEATGPCEAGYYCSSSSTLSMQLVTSGTGGPCTTGHYCPEETASPIPCPRGTVMSTTSATGNVTYLDRLFYCDLCSAGEACTDIGLDVYDAPCAAGYFCKLGAASAKPSCGEDFCADMYGLCPAGHYCPLSTSDPFLCGDGYYMNHTGQ
jgi:hypothetical protein